MNDAIEIRLIKPDEMPGLLALYEHLHAHDVPLPPEPVLHMRWAEFLGDRKIHCLVADLDGRLVGSCTLAIVPNLTRGARPFGLIENVVTHAVYRRKGIGLRLLRTALAIAWQHCCYKVMLLTGRHDEGVLRFYEQAGFRRGTKTGFMATPDE